METWYLYSYVYNDNIDEWTLKSFIDEQTYTYRWVGGRSFVELTNKEKDHLDPLYTGTYEMGLYYLDYELHFRGCIDTFTFINKDLWDLYDKNLEKYEKEFEDQSKFDLINKLSHIEFESESFSRDRKLEDERKNKYVYFLKKNEEIVYVGQTQATHYNRTNRPDSHTDKDFDSFDMIQIDDSMDLDIVETYYIAKHKPKYNKSFPIAKEWWNVIRFALKTSWSPYF